MKKIIAIILALVMLMSFAACSAPSDTTETPSTTPEASTQTEENASDVEVADESENEEFLVGLAFGALDLTPQILSENIIAICKEKGWEYTMTNADQDPSKLLSDVESLCQLGCDVICVRGITDDSMTPVQEACKEAGIPLIALSVVDQDGEYLTLCCDTTEAGADACAEWYAQYIQDHPDQEYNAGFVVGDYSFEAALCRWTYVRDVEGSNELANGEANWGAPNAMTLVEDWIKTYPEMNVIGSSSDEMTVGVIQALQDAGKSPDDYIVMSYDALDIMQDYILEGWCDASVGLDLEKHARTVCDILQKVKDGDTSSVEKLTKAYSIWMCTSENLQGILDGTAEKVYYEY